MNSACETRQLDIRGQICPSSLLTTLRAVNQQQSSLRAGTLVLCILTDSRDAATTIPNTVGNMGYAVAVERDEKHYRITIGAPRG